MKKILFTLIAMLGLVTEANAMSYEQARSEALFLTDKMAYELNLSDAQYEAAYEINLDYLMSVTGRSNVYGGCWERRNADIQYILYSWQWELFCAASYFFRPLYWDAGFWHFGIYARYPHRDYFYFGRPHFYLSYRGGHSWHRNGGRSYYANHHDHYRPQPHRDSHFGMRDGWNRGDYSTHNHSNSSTRVTGGRDGANHNTGDHATTAGGRNTTRTIHIGPAVRREASAFNQEAHRDNTPMQRNTTTSAQRLDGISTQRSSNTSTQRSSSTSTQHSSGISTQHSSSTSTQRSSSISTQRSSNISTRRSTYTPIQRTTTSSMHRGTTAPQRSSYTPSQRSSGGMSSMTRSSSHAGMSASHGSSSRGSSSFGGNRSGGRR